jgi:hypothetical protein
MEKYIKLALLFAAAIGASIKANAYQIQVTDDGPSLELGQGVNGPTPLGMCVWSRGDVHRTVQQGPMVRDPITSRLEKNAVILTLRYSASMTEELNVTAEQPLTINSNFRDLTPQHFIESCGVGYVRSITNVADLIFKGFIQFDNPASAQAFASAFSDDHVLRPSQLIDKAVAKTQMAPTTIYSAGFASHGAFEPLTPFSSAECEADANCYSNYKGCMVDGGSDSCKSVMDYLDTYASQGWPKGFSGAAYGHAGYFPRTAHVERYPADLE